MKNYIYAGTYTSGKSEGIYRFVFEDGKAEKAELFARIANPKYLCYYKDKIAAVCDFENGAGVALFDKEGKITDQLIIEDKTACYIGTYHENLYTANYHEGTVSKIINEDGLKLAKTVKIRDKAGCHQVLFHEGKVLVPTLFLDKVLIFDEELNQTGEIELEKNSGPRHGVFSDDQRYLYLACELSNDLYVIDMDDLSIVDRISVLENGKRDLTGTAAIRLYKNNIYVSTRGENVISRLSFDGKLKLEQCVDCGGDHPRDFIIRNGMLLCANRFSDELVIMKISENGELADIVQRLSIPEAISLI